MPFFSHAIVVFPKHAQHKYCLRFLSRLARRNSSFLRGNASPTKVGYLVEKKFFVTFLRGKRAEKKKKQKTHATLIDAPYRIKFCNVIKVLRCPHIALGNHPLKSQKYLRIAFLASVDEEK